MMLVSARPLDHRHGGYEATRGRNRGTSLGTDPLPMTEQLAPVHFDAPPVGVGCSVPGRATAPGRTVPEVVGLSPCVLTRTSKGGLRRHRRDAHEASERGRAGMPSLRASLAAGRAGECKAAPGATCQRGPRWRLGMVLTPGHVPARPPRYEDNEEVRPLEKRIAGAGAASSDPWASLPHTKTKAAQPQGRATSASERRLTE